jgi:hypothetical protein
MAMFIGTSILVACARARSIIAWAASNVMVMLCPPSRRGPVEGCLFADPGRRERRPGRGVAAAESGAAEHAGAEAEPASRAHPVDPLAGWASIQDLVSAR